jgi:hypothetical protein
MKTLHTAAGMFNEAKQNAAITGLHLLPHLMYPKRFLNLFNFNTSFSTFN